MNKKIKFWHLFKILTSIKIFNIYFKPHDFEKNQQNLKTSKSATIYNCASTMDYGLVQAQKIGKQNRKQLENTTDHYSAP